MGLALARRQHLGEAGVVTGVSMITVKVRKFRPMIYRTRNGSTIRWTGVDRAKRQTKRDRTIITAAMMNQSIRDQVWTGHIGEIGITNPSCGCGPCTRVRMSR